MGYSTALDNFHLTESELLFIMEKLTGCSAVGSALGSGPRGLGFESRHSDQKPEFVFRQVPAFHFCTFVVKYTNIALTENFIYQEEKNETDKSMFSSR